MINIYPLTRSFSIKATFWLPNGSERIDGEINYSPTGNLEICLNGSFASEKSNPFIKESYSAVFATNAVGECFTILDVNLSSRTGHLGSNYECKYFFNRVLIGPRHLNIDATVFKCASIKFQSLNSWLVRSPFLHEISRKGKYRNKIKVLRLKPIEFNVAMKPFKLIFAIAGNNSYSARTLKFECYDYLAIRHSKKEKLSWYLKTAYDFQVLLSLLLYEAERIEEFKLWISDKASKKNLDEQYYFIFRHINVSSEIVPEYEVPLPYQDIMSDFQSILDKWFSVAEDEEVLRNLNFSIFANPKQSSEHLFLSLLQAIECYSRIKGRSKYLSNDKYRTIFDEMVRNIPKEIANGWRDSLRKRLFHANEYSLRKRLDNIIRRLPRSLQANINMLDKRFVDKVIATRNYLTHRDIENRQDILDQKSIYNTGQDLKALLWYLISKEVGVPESKLLMAFQQCPKIVHRPKI